MIYILEGPDGVGKSTLASAIARETKGHIIHCSYNSRINENTKQYFIDVIHAAKLLNRFQDVVVDRWAPSEKVYGDVFRGGSKIDVYELIHHYGIKPDIKWVICQNDHAIENHLANKEKRIEMFGDMTRIVQGFKDFVDLTPEIDWIVYDYDKVSLGEFVKDLIE